MKNNIYDFPQGERKNAFKNAVIDYIREAK